MGNRQPLNLSEKELLYRRKQEGASHAEVASELGCAIETVRKLWRAYRRGLKKRKRGRPAAGILSTYPPEMAPKALELKQAHPHWGPANVLLDLRKYFEGKQVHFPSPSRLSAFFRVSCPKAVQRHGKPTPPPSPPPSMVRQIHYCWQIDAKEAIKLENGEVASYLDIRDPVSAVMIASQAFLTTRTPATYRKITLSEIRDTLRQAFSEWGRPAEIQTDHEDVYAGAPQSDFPMPFTLWLLGLGIKHCFSRDHCPTDQPHIERNHRTLGDMSWKDQLPKDLADFQQQLDTCRLRYNHEFPSHASDCQGQAPLVRHPQAVFSGRPYQTSCEWDQFDLASVDHYLAKFRWVRKADSHGVVFVGNHPYNLGKKYKGQSVLVRFQPEQRSFSFETEQGFLIKLLPAVGLDTSDLTGLIPNPIASGIPFQLTFPWVGV
jgi:hypothetical protein